LSLNDTINLPEINNNMEEEEDSNHYDENVEQVEKLADNFEFYGANVTDKGLE
jgi:hypothetical protein